MNWDLIQETEKYCCCFHTVKLPCTIYIPAILLISWLPRKRIQNSWYLMLALPLCTPRNPSQGLKYFIAACCPPLRLRLCRALFPFPFPFCLTCNAPRARILHAIQSISLFMSNLFVPPVPSDANRWCRTSFSRFSYTFFPVPAPQSKHVPLSRRGSTNCIWRNRERERESSLFRWLQWGHILLLLQRLSLSLSVSHSHSISFSAINIKEPQENWQEDHKRT